MRTENEIRVRIRDIVNEEDLDPINPMFKYTGAYPVKGKSTRGYRHDFYVGFFHALEWVLGDSPSSEKGEKR